MQKNMGTADRSLRGVIAVLIGVFYLLGAVEGPLALVLGVVAVVFLVTGIVGICPLYQLLHIRTTPAAARQQ